MSFLPSNASISTTVITPTALPSLPYYYFFFSLSRPFLSPTNPYFFPSHGVCPPSLPRATLKPTISLHLFASQFNSLELTKGNEIHSNRYHCTARFGSRYAKAFINQMAPILRLWCWDGDDTHTHIHTSGSGSGGRQPTNQHLTTKTRKDKSPSVVHHLILGSCGKPFIEMHQLLNYF